MRHTVMLVFSTWAASAAACAHAPDRSQVLPRVSSPTPVKPDTATIRELERDDPLASPEQCARLGRRYRELGTIAARLRSQVFLERARARYPDDIGITMELGRTYFAQRFFPDAVACFRTVLEMDPAHCDARFMIASYHYLNWKRMNEYTDDLAIARQELRSVTRCDTTNADAAFMYLVTQYAQQEFSLEDGARFVERFPDRAEFHLFRGVIDFERGLYEESARHMARGLSLLDDATRETYETLGTILPIPATDEWKRARDDERSTMRRAYWVVADPDPTTAVNERELEHLTRMFLADALYSNEPGSKRGWDTDRGGAFIKFGRPMTVDYSLGDDVRNGKAEVWSYVLGGTFHQFLFVDEFLNGNPRIPYDVDYLVQFIRYAPEMTALPPRSISVPGELDVVAFRDGDMSGSVYVALHVDADSMRAAVDLARVDHFLVRAAWYDADWRLAGAFAESLWTSQTPVRRHRGQDRYEIARRISVPFDRYHLAFAFADASGGSRTIARADTDASRFMGDRLALSDILLCADGGATQNAIERGGESMWPRVTRSYRDGEKLAAYVEVYHLTLTGRVSTYEVRFAIYPGRDSQPLLAQWGRRAVNVVGLMQGDPSISQTFRREGSVHDDHERIAIDIDSLAPGRYELVVEVTDLRNRTSAIAHTPFVKEPRAAQARR